MSVLAIFLSFGFATQVRALTFNITYDSSVTGQTNATQITNAFGIATQVMQALYTNSSSVNITVFFSSSVGLGASSTSFIGGGSFSYSDLTNVLRAARTTAADSNSVASLPASDPTSGPWFVASAEVKALELSSSTFSNLFQINPNDTIDSDGDITFASTVSYNFNPTNRAAVLANFDFIAVAEHEIAEVMGRSTFDFSGAFVPYDLFRFTASGTRSFNANDSNVYFSTDNGVTVLKQFNPNNGGDIQDWATSTPPDAYDAFISNGQVGRLSSADLTALDIIGYNLNFAAPHLTGTPLANGNFKIGFTNVTGLNFTVLATTNISLSVSNWTNLGTPSESPAGQYQLTDTQANSSTQRFYLVRLN